MRRTLLTGQEPAVLKFVADLSPIERPVWRDVAGAFGVLREDGAMIAGVVFSNHRPEFSTLELSAASVTSHAFSIGIVSALGDYAFRQLSANRVWARTSTANRRARAMLRGLGFTEEGVQACHYGPKSHAVIARLLRSEWERRKIRTEEVRRAA